VIILILWGALNNKDMVDLPASPAGPEQSQAEPSKLKTLPQVKEILLPSWRFL
jgi:hypothetical protein